MGQSHSESQLKSVYRSGLGSRRRSNPSRPQEQGSLTSLQIKKYGEGYIIIQKHSEKEEMLIRHQKTSKEYILRRIIIKSENQLNDRMALLSKRKELIKSNIHLLKIVDFSLVSGKGTDGQSQGLFGSMVDICGDSKYIELLLEYPFQTLGDEIRQRRHEGQASSRGPKSQTDHHLRVNCSKPKHQFFQESELWSILYSCVLGLQAIYSTNELSHECLTQDSIFIDREGIVKIGDPIVLQLQRNYSRSLEVLSDTQQPSSTGGQRLRKLGHELEKVSSESKFHNLIGCGALPHISPELMCFISDGNYYYYNKELSDVYILGCVFLELMSLEPVRPLSVYCKGVGLSESRTDLQVEDIEKEHSDLIAILQKEHNYSDSLCEMVRNMLKVNVRMRMSLSEITDKIESYSIQNEEESREEAERLEIRGKNQQPQKLGQEKQVVDPNFEPRNFQAGRSFKSELQASGNYYSGESGLQFRNENSFATAFHKKQPPHFSQASRLDDQIAVRVTHSANSFSNHSHMSKVPQPNPHNESSAFRKFKHNIPPSDQKTVVEQKYTFSAHNLPLYNDFSASNPAFNVDNQVINSANNQQKERENEAKLETNWKERFSMNNFGKIQLPEDSSAKKNHSNSQISRHLLIEGNSSEGDHLKMTLGAIKAQKQSAEHSRISSMGAVNSPITTPRFQVPQVLKQNLPQQIFQGNKVEMIEQDRKVLTSRPHTDYVPEMLSKAKTFEEPYFSNSSVGFTLPKYASIKFDFTSSSVPKSKDIIDQLQQQNNNSKLWEAKNGLSSVENVSSLTQFKNGAPQNEMRNPVKPTSPFTVLGKLLKNSDSSERIDYESPIKVLKGQVQDKAKSSNSSNSSVINSLSKFMKTEDQDRVVRGSPGIDSNSEKEKNNTLQQKQQTKLNFYKKEIAESEYLSMDGDNSRDNSRVNQNSVGRVDQLWEASRKQGIQFYSSKSRSPIQSIDGLSTKTQIVHQNPGDFFHSPSQNFEIQGTSDSGDKHESSENISSSLSQYEPTTIDRVPYEPHIHTRIEEQQYEDGSMYRGQKVSDKRHGNGKMFFSDGGFYEGHFKNDLIHGYGRMYLANGKLAYDGNFYEGTFNGFGILYNDRPNDVPYVSLSDQAQDRKQQLDFATNMSLIDDYWFRFEGHFKNDEKNGKCHVYFTNGEQFDGYCDKNTFEGKGRYIRANRQYIDGVWKNNVLIEVTGEGYVPEKER